MTYRIRRVPPGFTAVHPEETFVVERCFDHSDPYTLATYPNEGLARWMLNSLHTSLEVKKGLATIVAEVA